MAQHLTPEQFDRFAKRALSPRELVAAGEHLAACEPCRERASDPQKLDEIFAFLHRDLETQAKVGLTHINYQQLEAYVNGEMDQADREIVDSHVELCAMCGEELRDLQKLRLSLEARETASHFEQPHLGEERPSEPLTIHSAASDQEMPKSATPFWRSPGYLAGIASAIAIVLVVAWFVPARRHVAATQGPAVSTSGQSASQTASSVGAGTQPELQTPAQLAALIGKTGTLLGTSSQSAFALLAPVGTFVEDAQPTFRWQPLAGATSYRVTIFDAGLSKVAASPALSATEWRSSAALERGTVYLWQVSATRNGEQVVVPAPPVPEARFAVLDLSQANNLKQLKKDQPNAHFALGRAYAGSGVLDEAEREFRLVSGSDADYALAQKFIHDLEALRHPGR